MYREDQETELKVELTKDIKKEIVAFANTNNGTIYIGIDDNGKIIGLKQAEKDLEALSGMIREGIKSDLTLYTKIYIERVEDKDIIIVKVNEAPNKPYYLSDKGLKSSGVYLRHGNVSVQANEEVIKKLLIESNSNSFENNVSNLQDLNFEYLKNIFKNHNIEIDENKFKALNIINSNNEYTNLGLLLSDECPYSIKCAIFNGTNKLEFRDRKEFTGSVLKQVNDTFEYLDLYNKTKGKIVGLERIDTKDYPEYALRESLLNAVIHRDYNFTGSILVSLFDDHFEITSLGGLVKGISIEDLYNGVSESRNPNLANIFYRLKYVESFGTGIGRIIESYKEYDKEPLILNTKNTFKVTLYNVNYIKENNIKILPTNLTQEEQIIEYLKKNSKINRLIVESLLDVSKTRANDILNKMINDNILIQTGTGKNIYYVLK
ncbi:MAG TPA: putative DNA binding domain-containing protein [Candidatus Aphodocola excrementigallinarum]|uniref:DNA binding domain-containing protein n=1 Tax=Candidatus Aphodocola excrementigallinarum TaxID=2840670 RepID=A0A9D1INB4_9FIRM|nr:putative DNA binding domain-containing protein [Candidatus Aphodocola excrementigallinarum]